MRPLTTERNRAMLSGGIGLVLLVAFVVLGIKVAFGAFDEGYELRGTFAAAGQGLLEGSSVAIKGVNVGDVSDIQLVENRAVVTLKIDKDVRVPADASAVIRPKTLFGEKYVDIEVGDAEGPFLQDGDEIEDTLGGFELEQVLAEAHPILKAIDPAEVAVVLDELATAGDGLGENINRSIVNGRVLAELQASNDAEVRQFLSDMALLSEEIDALAPDLLAGADDLNAALPTLNSRGAQLNQALVELAGLSSDVADLLDANREFTETALTKGSESLQIVFDRRGQVQPLLQAIQRYTQTLAEAIRIEVGDGTMMAAIKNLVSVEAAAGASASRDAPEPPPGGIDGLLPEIPDVDDPLGGLGGLLGGDGGSTDDADQARTGLLDLLLGGGGG